MSYDMISDFLLAVPSQESTASSQSDSAIKSSRRVRNDQKWESLKDEIYRYYMTEDNTLHETMQTIFAQHGFQASPRKWKQKLKEWKFDKNISSNDMNILVVKAEKRERDEGKDTVFFFGENQISRERLENFKRRKMAGAVSPSAETPVNITYHTPGADDIDSPPTLLDEQEGMVKEDETNLLPNVEPSIKTSTNLQIINEAPLVSAGPCLMTTKLMLLRGITNTRYNREEDVDHRLPPNRASSFLPESLLSQACKSPKTPVDNSKHFLLSEEIVSRGSRIADTNLVASLDMRLDSSAGKISIQPAVINPSIETAQTMLAGTHLRGRPGQVDSYFVQPTSEDETHSQANELTPTHHSGSPSLNDLSQISDCEVQPGKSSSATFTAAKRALQLALEKEKAGSSLEEIFKYLDSFPEYFGSDDISAFCNALERLAFRHKRKRLLLEAKMAMELVVMGCDKQFGAFSKETLRSISRRASIFKICGLYDLAETSYRKVIAECKKSGDTKHLVGTQQRLAGLFQHLGRHCEALILLLQLLFGFDFSLNHLSDTSTVLDSILQSHAKMYLPSVADDASACIIRLKGAVDSLPKIVSKSAQSIALQAQILRDIVSLAKAYLSMDEMDTAEPCLDFLKSKIEVLSNQSAPEYRMIRIQALLQCGICYRKQGQLMNSLRQVTTVFGFLKLMSIPDDHLADTVTETENLFAKLKEEFKSLPNDSGSLSASIAFQGAVLAEESYRRHVQDRGQVDDQPEYERVPTEAERGAKTNQVHDDLVSCCTSSAMSYKYGVTYSAGTMSIVSNSIFIAD